MEKEQISKEQMNQMVEEIKQIERELYLKRSRLSAYKLMMQKENDTEYEDLKKKFDELIEEMGQLSTEGNSVEDVRKERSR
ncbi:MAG: hypothetical protein QG588_2072 [Candidatus Poribacteria bacterium]|nr:hypothetical protein [Candidatus Poribacteria bacterium]